MRILVCSLACTLSLFAHAEDTKAPIEMPKVVPEVQPFSKAEIQQGLQEMQQRLNTRIEDWGKTLKREDFEWSWRGRQLKQPKRQEVCNIFQGVVNDTYNMAQKNKARLNEEDQKRLENRHLFIEALGYENNIVDTKMGFDCRLH